MTISSLQEARNKLKQFFSQYHHKKSKKYFEQEDFESALMHIQKSINLNVTYENLEQMGINCLRLERHKDAYKAFKNSCELNRSVIHLEKVVKLIYSEDVFTFSERKYFLTRQEGKNSELCRNKLLEIKKKEVLIELTPDSNPKLETRVYIPCNQGGSISTPHPRIVLAKNLSPWESWISDQIKELDDCKSVEDLLMENDFNYIKYGNLLQCFEWRYKRIQVLIRDKYLCKKCGSLDIHNHVHHTYYVKDELPWNILTKSLETLCRDCHIKVHQENDIPIYNKEHGTRTEVGYGKLSYCTRCGGIGYIPKFSHVQNGICFQCWGFLSSGYFRNSLKDLSLTEDDYGEKHKRESYRSYLNGLEEEDYINEEFYSRFVKIDSTSNQIIHKDLFEEEPDDLPF